MLIALVLCLALSVAGIVLMVEGRAWGSVVSLAGLAVAGMFYRWSRRQWADHRRPD